MFNLCPYNTFGLQVHSESGIIVNSVSDLRKVHADNVIILGHGSDVLFTDDYQGTVIINQIRDLCVEKDGADYIVKAGAGLILDDLISTLISRGIYGLENLSAIPGTVGAAPIQNVGAYGVEIGEFITELKVYDLQRHIQETFTNEDCKFGYRSSYFKKHKERKLVITQVTFRLSSVFSPKLVYKGLQEESFENALALRNKVIELRNRKLPDPKIAGNAGSFFKNPIVNSKIAKDLESKYDNVPIYPMGDGMCKIAAGWLIEKAGCKGITHGNVGTWEKQSLVIVNRGGAKPYEIVALAKYIMAEVFNMFGIKLDPEVRTYDAQGEVSWENL